VGLRIFFIGDDNVGSNARSLREAFIALGHRCASLDSTDVVSPRRGSFAHLHRRAFGRPPARSLSSFRRRAIEAVEAVRPDLVVVFKGTWLDAATSMRTRAVAPIIDYHPDDIGVRDDVSPGYLESVSLFRLSVTHRVCNVTELKSLGAKDVILLPQAFDPNLHAPLPGIRNAWDVSFVGTCRPEREASLAMLASLRRFRLRVAGGGWRRSRLPGAIVSGPAYGIDMAKIVSASTMSIGFVNHQSRDLRTYRSFEVPAIGSLFLAERTTEHEDTFRDRVEAVFFSSNDELIDLVSYYSAHATEAATVAAAGQSAVWRLDATYERRATQILERLTR
jgi:Glycosyl transferases group 1